MTTYPEAPGIVAIGPRHVDLKDLTPEQRALLDRLVDGATIAGAATSEFVSLRTANRRIAGARALFGVRTTREAVLAYQRQTSPHPAQSARDRAGDASGRPESGRPGCPRSGHHTGADVAAPGPGEPHRPGV